MTLYFLSCTENLRLFLHVYASFYHPNNIKKNKNCIADLIDVRKMASLRKVTDFSTFLSRTFHSSGFTEQAAGVPYCTEHEAKQYL